MANTVIGLILAAAVLAACQTPHSRIKRNQAAFDAFPPQVQQAIREGRAEVGFTPEQVMMALGKPDRVYTQKAAASSQEVWEYGVGGGASVGFGLGMFSAGGGSGYGTSLGVNSDVRDPRAELRVTLENGRVAVVEHRVR
jgi:hypothetical protein